MTTIFRPRARRSVSFRAIISSPDILRRYETFRAFVAPPVALDLARAEAWASDVGVDFFLNVDTESTDEEGELRYTVRATFEGFSTSLSGIDDIGDYLRIVKAKLASDLRERILIEASKGLRSYDLGKYTLEIDAIADNSEFETESFGDVESFGYVSISKGYFGAEAFEGEDLTSAERAYLSALYGTISVTDDRGFTYVEYFDTRAEFERRRGEARAAYEDFLAEQDVEDEFSGL